MSEQKIALEYLERHADDLDRQIRDLDRQKEELADKRDAVRKAALLLRGEDNTPEVGAAPGVPQSVRPQPFAGLEVDYSGAHNLLSRLRCVGRAAPDGILWVGPVAQLLIADGVSSAKFNNLRRSVDKLFRVHECFEYVRPGTYRYHDAPPERASIAT